MRKFSIWSEDVSDIFSGKDFFYKAMKKLGAKLTSKLHYCAQDRRAAPPPLPFEKKGTCFL